MEGLLHILHGFTFKDALDILASSLLLYYFFLLIKGTRAVQILQGIGVLLLILVVVRQFQLETIFWLLQYLLVAIAVGVAIVFQPELRRALGTLGRGGILGAAPWNRLNKETLARVVDELLWAVSIFSQTKTGALIVIERDTGLEEYTETGTRVNGEVSSKLLLSIFMPKSPLHDGAVILRGNKVVAAGCYLPLSENMVVSLDKHFGTRHRAALGLAEQTDALVVVVSEETGGISISWDGKLSGNVNEETLKKMLIQTLSAPLPQVHPAWLRSVGGKTRVGVSQKQP